MAVRFAPCLVVWEEKGSGHPANPGISVPVKNVGWLVENLGGTKETHDIRLAFWNVALAIANYSM